jgi:hypothetical protein
MIFSVEKDARRVMEALPKRFGRYGLRLHPDKTRMIEFNQPLKTKDDDQHPPPRRETFDFLGFTHYWGKSRNGSWAVKRKTAAKRFRRSIKAIKEWCRTNRHLSFVEQWATLGQKLKGHFGYYGITGNSQKLANFHYEVRLIWHKWLSRRSQRGKISWERFSGLLEQYPLPPPRVVYSIYRRSAKCLV